MKKTTIDENDNFVVEITEDVLENTDVITSKEDFTSKLVQRAISSYSGGDKTYSQNITEQTFMRTALTEDTISKLAFKAQDNIANIQEINGYIDFYLNKDDIIGKTYEVIEANVNAKYQLSYPIVEGRNKQNALNKVKAVIDKFNQEIELEELIIETIPYAYSNGNRILYLREKPNGGYQVDKYPLGVARISDYKINNEPIVNLSIPDILSRLSGKTVSDFGYGTTMNVSDYSLFKNYDDEVKANFPPEVYSAYKNQSDTIVRLNTDKTAVIRTNNRGKKYGLSPIFKALSPALKLEIQEKSDSSNSKARGKKIIFQKIDSKLLGENGKDIDLSLPVYSHAELIRALKSEVAVYTGAPWVESITYVEPKIDNTVTDSLNYYKSKVLSALGIAFLNGDSKTGMVVSQLNFTELMRTIDKISTQLEHNINKWYKYVLEKEGLPIAYAPTITVMDSELMELELRMALVEKLFNAFGASYKTAYEMLGVDYNDEINKRKEENEQKLDELVFYPRMNANTFTSDGVDNKDKQNPTVNKQVQNQGGDE